jgi:hypothetical protein
VLVFTTNRFGGVRRQIDIHALPLGRAMAHRMTGPDLYAAMEQLGIDGIDRSMGQQDLCLRYGAWIQEQAEEK